jgi:valyl-tRNA synthetase
MWHEVADHYLEAVKYRVYKGDDIAVKYCLYHIGLGLVKILSPLLPHVTEEIYHNYYKKLDGAKSVHISSCPEKLHDGCSKAVEQGQIIVDIIAALRRWKSEAGIPLNRELERIEIDAGPNQAIIRKSESDICATARIKAIDYITESDLTEKIVSIRPILSKIGPKYKSDGPELKKLLESAPSEELINKFNQETLTLTLPSGKKLTVERSDFEFEKELLSHGKKVQTVQVGEIIILIPE